MDLPMRLAEDNDSVMGSPTHNIFMLVPSKDSLSASKHIVFRRENHSSEQYCLYPNGINRI